MKKIEKGLIGLVLFGILLKLMSWPFAGEVLVLSLSSLSMIYFYGGFYFFRDKKNKKSNRTLSIVSGVVLSVITIGFMFKVQYWVFASELLSVGFAAALVLLVVTFLFKMNAQEELISYYKNMIIRTAIATTISGLFYFTSTATLVHIQYRNNPEEARVKALFYTDPSNNDYRRQYDAYMLSVDSLYQRQVLERDNEYYE